MNKKKILSILDIFPHQFIHKQKLYILLIFNRLEGSEFRLRREALEKNVPGQKPTLYLYSRGEVRDRKVSCSQDLENNMIQDFFNPTEKSKGKNSYS